MSKNKYDFIVDLLENKNLTPNQRERVLFLTKEEIKKDSLISEDLEDRIRKLEIIISGATYEKNKSRRESNSKTEQNPSERKTPIYFEPSNLYKYLFDYNQNQILKSTCHEIDSNELENIINYCGTKSYDFVKHREKILEAFEEHDKKRAPSAVKKVIRGYLTGKYHNQIPIADSHEFFNLNWSSPSLENWCFQNQGVPPNIDEGLMERMKKTGFELNPTFQTKSGSSLSNFSDFVIYFKRLFHVRKDNSLKSLIQKENEQHDWKDKVEFEIIDTEFPSNIEIFTVIDDLISAYTTIIEICLEEQKEDSSEKAKIKLSLAEKENTIEFSILHKKSVYGKTLIVTKNRLGSKVEGLIKKINGICNLYLQADFENKTSYRVGIWNKPDLWTTVKPESIKLSSPVGGVEHIFEIVKHIK